MLSTFKDFWNFFCDNFKIIWDNKIIFITWALMCGGVGYSFSSKRIGQLKKNIRILENEIDSMKKLYPQLTPGERLFAGENEPECSTSAYAVSREIQTKRFNLNRKWRKNVKHGRE